MMLQLACMCALVYKLHYCQAALFIASSSYCIPTKHRTLKIMRGKVERRSSQRQPSVGITMIARSTSNTVPSAQNTWGEERGGGQHTWMKIPLRSYYTESAYSSERYFTITSHFITNSGNTVDLE